MPSTIGIRVYQISVHKGGKRQSFDSEDFSETVDNFITNYVKKHSTSTQDSELERSWYFELKEADNLKTCRGYIHYGTFGFESTFVDARTKKRNYRRKVSDVEEIPLYFEFWHPKNEPFSFVAFQSFQGRSCINIVMTALKTSFEKKNPSHKLIFSKLSPNNASNNVYSKAPVKRVRLVRRDAPGDLADRYFDNPSPESINFEVTISARRNGTLGSFGGLSKSLKKNSRSVVSYDGIDFPEAVAEVRIGNRTRKVGVLGFNGDAGVIDITNDIKRGLNGHPTFQSISKETEAILKEMYEVMKGDKH